MRKTLLFIIIIAILIIGISFYYETRRRNEEKIMPEKTLDYNPPAAQKKIAMIIAFKNFRDEEYFVPKGILEGAGAEVKTVSNEMGIARGADGGEVEIDLLVSELNPALFDAVVFIGGPGCLENLDNENSYRVAKETVSKGKVIAAICISPIILARAGVLEDKEATVWSSVLDRGPVAILKENGAIYQDKSVVVDGKIITGNGPGASKEFGEVIIEVLTNK